MMIKALLVATILVTVSQTSSYLHSSLYRKTSTNTMGRSHRMTVLSSSILQTIDSTIENSNSNGNNNNNNNNSEFQSQIFCNVELNGEHVEAVGFDMDFTLAQYNEEFDLLAYEGAKHKLHYTLGYPKDVLNFPYSSTAFTRGLIIDKVRGNILKVDRHKYVRKVYHGMNELPTDARKATYGQQVVSFTESNYVNIDTLFLLIDALLFANLVDYRDKNMDTMSTKTYEQMYKDVRNCIDLCHKDGVIKEAVMKNPSKYIIYDEGMVPMLQRLRRSNKRVFLLTNSLWDYTNVVMEYLVHGKGDNMAIKQWESLYDIVIVGASKPSFLTDEYLSMFRVDKDGSLRNIEDKDQLNIKNISDSNERRVFQGGYWQDLHRMMDIKSGERILYVGDHMYSDILRSKRTLGWRTCLIIPELEHELKIYREEAEMGKKVLALRRLQYDLDEYLDILQLKKRMGSIDVDESLIIAERKSVELKAALKAASDQFNAKFNVHWGQLFKSGIQDSRFAKQVTDYACLYTGRATNLGRVSPTRAFRPIMDFMPHDITMFDNEAHSLNQSFDV